MLREYMYTILTSEVPLACQALSSESEGLDA